MSVNLLTLSIRSTPIVIIIPQKHNPYYTHGYSVQDVIPSLAKLQKYINTTDDDPLTKYCTCFCHFIAIHPLSDGNGHFARSQFTVVWNEELLHSKYYKEYLIAVIKSTWQSHITHQVNIQPFKQFMLDHPFLWKFK